jgi:hypothetical protein
VFAARVRAPYERVAEAIVGDAKTWTWFPTFKEGSTDGDRRRITIGGFTYVETILERTQNVLTFRVDETTSPYANAIVEEWRVDEHDGDGVVRWTFATDPRWMLRLPGSRPIIRTIFRRAMRSLEARLA